MKSVGEIMVTRPRCCRKQDTLQRVVSDMIMHCIGSLPVVDKENKVIGIITDRDILSALFQNERRTFDELSVEEAVAQEGVFTCYEKDPVTKALKIMRTKKISRLPVTNEDGYVKGIITLNTIIRQLHGSNYGAEIVFEGKENVVNTLHSIAERNKRLSFEYGDFME